METSLPINGGCACGKISFQCNALPALMFQCHCRDCQRATGGLYAPNVWFYVEDIEIRGELQSYTVDSDAGNVVDHDFCGECGSPIGNRTSDHPEMRGFRAATFNDMDWLRPAANIYMRNSPSWEYTNPDLPAVDGQPSEEFISGVIDRGS